MTSLYTRNAIILTLFFLPIWVDAHALQTFTILMTDDGFEPSELSVVQGDTITFINNDDDFRWPASNIHPTHSIYSDFDPKQPVASGSEWSFTFTKAGSWRMHDHLIPKFTGEIIVEEDPDFEPESIEEESSWFVTFSSSIRSFFVRLYYTVFSGKRDTALGDGGYRALIADEARLKDWLHIIGPEEVMQGLIAESGGGSSFDCHGDAHTVGRLSYDLFGASVYTDGDAACHSGFYHGVMEAFIAEHGTDTIASDIEELCDSLQTSFDIFECYHGVGHGMMAFDDYDLPAALDDCTLLSVPYNQASCYGGVFMENIVAGQGNGSLEGHDTRWLTDDPHYPCNTIGDDPQMLWNCYVMQTSWMFDLFHGDYARVAGECLNARTDMIGPCFTSYGRDSAGRQLRDPLKIIASCDLVPKETGYQADCLTGGLFVILDFWGPDLQDQGEEFCAAIGNNSWQSDCYSIVEGRKSDLNT